MILKTYKAISGSYRHKKRIQLITRNSKKCRVLCYKYSRALGRNINGHIIAWHRGGGVKRLYRLVDYWRRSIRQVGIVQRIEYNPYITSNIALVKYPDSSQQYILAPEGLVKGNEIYNGQIDINRSKIGSATVLDCIKPGVFVYNVELRPGDGGQFIRAAGTYGKILRGATKYYIRIRLPSGLIRYFSKMCAASIGRVSNVWHKSSNLGGAGIRRRLGWRPIVRGTAKNAVDHPHGGKSGPGRSSVTPWGKSTK